MTQTFQTAREKEQLKAEQFESFKAYARENKGKLLAKIMFIPGYAFEAMKLIPKGELTLYIRSVSLLTEASKLAICGRLAYSALDHILK